MFDSNLINVNGAVISSVASDTLTGKAICKVGAGTIVEAGRRGTLINTAVTDDTRKAIRAVAGKGADEVVAGAAVGTGR